VSARPDIRSAFTLIELLIVIAIVAMLSALTLPAFNSIRNAGGLTKSANDIAGILEQARAYAMAQNTYTWVGFRRDNADTPSDTLVVGVIASKTGSTNPAVDAVPLGKLARFDNVKIVELSPSPAPTAATDQLINSTLAFTNGTNKFISQVIRWDSRGEARISSSLSRLIEIGLQSAGRNASNNAAVQISGLSGTVIVYRPQLQP
jgi:prepilin-type N-terminal cleavage/methylation domain-containing protein